MHNPRSGPRQDQIHIAESEEALEFSVWATLKDVSQKANTSIFYWSKK